MTFVIDVRKCRSLVVILLFCLSLFLSQEKQKMSCGSVGYDLYLKIYFPDLSRVIINLM
jgi:hypothetical protein